MISRAFNVAAASLGLIVLSPFLLFFAALIKVQDGGTVLYRARRLGMGGKAFDVLKLRTMVMDADRQGIGLTTHSDGRITSLGRFLRRFKLDELPQLWNVVTGTMNLVGPRPEDPRYVACYTPEQKEILSYRPGLTSPASLAYRDEEQLLTSSGTEEFYLREILPKKLALDLDYVKRQSVCSDIVLILRTIVSVAS